MGCAKEKRRKIKREKQTTEEQPNEMGVYLVPEEVQAGGLRDRVCL